MNAGSFERGMAHHSSTLPSLARPPEPMVDQVDMVKPGLRDASKNYYSSQPTAVFQEVTSDGENTIKGNQCYYIIATAR